jgi:hypothetical protein
LVDFPAHIRVCVLPVRDEGAPMPRLCREPATTTRKVGRADVPACARCAAALDDLRAYEADDGHCHNPDTSCFQGDGEDAEVCACECDRCVKAREQLLREQDEDPDEEPSDPAGSPGH